MKKLVIGTAAAVLAAALAPAAQAQNFVTNGSFSGTTVTSGGKTTATTTASEIGLNGYALTGWTSSNDTAGDRGYNFIFNPTLSGAAAYTSASEYKNPNGAYTVQLYTSATGLKTDPASLVSPDGGNFLAADPSYHPGTISQQITGLTVGQSYTLSFYWAAGQQVSYTGTTTEGWTGSLGTSTFATPVVTTPSQGFNGWTKFSTTITATSASETLKFLATGGPTGGQPPFALLDGVSLTAVPEPGTWAMMALGAGLMGFAMRRRGKVARLANA